VETANTGNAAVAPNAARRADSSPQRSSPYRSWWWYLNTRWGLGAIFVVAAVTRLLLAPHFGFYGDLRYFREWAGRLQDTGFRNFYAPTYFADYPPGYLYVLALIGRITQNPGYQLLKFPVLIGDLCLAWLSALLAERIAPESLRKRMPIRPIVCAAVLFNPAILGVGAVWGQVDSIPSACVVGTLLLLFTGRRRWQRDTGAMALFAAAVAMKPQSGFLVPVIAYLLVRRYLVETPRTDRLMGAARLATVIGTSLVLWGISGLPFGKSPIGLLRFYSESARTYPVTSANAFNFWGLFGFFERDSEYYWNGQFNVVKVLGIEANRVGILLVGLSVIGLLFAAHRAIARGCNQARTLIATGVAINLVAYTLLTRMHERYMFPVLACLAPLLVWRWFRAAYWTLSILYVINLWYPFALYNGQWDASGRVGRVYGLAPQPIFRWFFGDINAVNTDQKKFWCVVVVVAMLGFVAGCYRWLDRPQLPRCWERRIRNAAPATASPVAASHTAAAHATASPAAASPAAASPAPRAFSPAVAADPQPAADPAPSTESAGPRDAFSQWIGSARRAVALPREGDASTKGFLTYGPRIVVAVACTFGLLALTPELRGARTLNDSTFHLQMIRWASQQLSRGRIPFDGWFPDLTLGSSFFHHYQSLPYTITAIVGRVLGMSVGSIYLWMIYLLLSLWPISVYWSGRLMGWGRWVAAAAALISPFIVSVPSYGYEHGSYTFQGWGVYTQLWGMWLLPLAWGFTAQSIRRGRGYWIAALTLALTMATHLMTGYLAMLCLPVFALLSTKHFLERIKRLVMVAVGAVLTASWVLVPLLLDRDYSAQSTFYKGTLYNDSYPASTILNWLIRGNLYDSKHLPVVTVLAAIGFLVCVINIHEERSRILIGVWTVSLIMYFGRATWKSAIDILPGSEDLQMHRFIIGVQFAGIIMAGIGLVAVARAVATGVRAAANSLTTRTAPASIDASDSAHSESNPPRGPEWLWAGQALAIAVVAAVVLAPSWRHTWTYDRGDANFIDQQRAYDRTDGASIDRLLRIAEERGGGRVYAGTRGNWGPSYKVGFVPVLHMISHNDVDGVGFTFRTVQSLTTDIEASFDENNLAQYEMLNVRYVLMPADRTPSVPHTEIARDGNNVLYGIETTGYFQVVDRIGSIEADRVNINDRTAGFRSSSDATNGVYPGIAFNGADPLPDTVAAPQADRAGGVLNQSNVRENGWFQATVRANRKAVVVLKATYDPRWTVTVDGKRAKPVMMAPSIVGVEVEAGQHEIAFSYRSFQHYPWLFLLGAFALLVLGQWRHRRTWVERLRRSGDLLKGAPAKAE